MKYFASLDENSVVTNVIVVSDEDAPTEPQGLLFLAGVGLLGNWKETSYDGSFRGKYASIGDTYDSQLDEFIYVPEENPQ